MGRGAVAGFGGVGDAALDSPPGGPSRAGPGVPCRTRRLRLPAVTIGRRSPAGMKLLLGGLAAVTPNRQTRLRGTTTGDRHGANLKTPRAGGRGTGGLAVSSASTSLDVARRRGPRVLWARRCPARPRYFFERRGCEGETRAHPAPTKECGRRSVGFSPPHPEEGAKAPVSKDAGGHRRGLMLRDALLCSAPQHEERGSGAARAKSPFFALDQHPPPRFVR